MRMLMIDAEFLEQRRDEERAFASEVGVKRSSDAAHLVADIMVEVLAHATPAPPTLDNMLEGLTLSMMKTKPVMLPNCSFGHVLIDEIEEASTDCSYEEGWHNGMSWLLQHLLSRQEILKGQANDPR